MQEEMRGKPPAQAAGPEQKTTGRKRLAATVRAGRPGAPWVRYVCGVSLVLGSTLLNGLAFHIFSQANLVMIYLLAVIVAAVYLGRGPSTLVAILSVVAFDFFFTPPHLTLLVSDTEYLFTFIVLFIVGLVISNLTALTHQQTEDAQRLAAQNIELYGLSRDLAVAASLDAVARAVLTHVGETFHAHAAIFLPVGGVAEVHSASSGFAPDDSDVRTASATFRDIRATAIAAAKGTLPGVRYLPLKTALGTIGVLGIKPADDTDEFATEQSELLEAFASQAALAIERVQLAEQAQRAEVLEATERLQATLLNSISHDLRTPLVSILGALSTLQDDDSELDSADRRTLVDNAIAETVRLNHLVGNLLDIARIESGGLRLMCEPCDVEDLIGAAIEQLDRRLRNRSVSIALPTEMLLVSMDFVLVKQVLVNLLDNALKYSPEGSPIEIAVDTSEAGVLFEVADRGIGIPEEQLEQVFGKFYRLQQSRNIGGTGLGLSICKGIVEAHNGRISAHNRAGGGTAISFTLPRGLIVEEAK